MPKSIYGIKDFLKIIPVFLNDSINPKFIFTVAILYSPITIGSWNPFNYITVINILNFFLFFLLAKEIIHHKRILKTNYFITISLFILSFYLSMFFGLDYKQMNDFTDYDSSLFAVLFLWTQVIIMQIGFIYFFYLSINSYSDIIYYIKVILISGLIINFVGLVYTPDSVNLVGIAKVGLSFDDPNYLGRFEAIIISICLIFILFSKISKLKKLILSVLFAISFNFLLLSVSRAALLSLAIVVIIILFFYPSKGIRYTLIGVNIIAFLFLIVLVGSQKVGTIGGDSGLASSFVDLSNATRIALVLASLSAFWDYPIFGIGIYNFFNAYINHGYMPVDLPLGAKITVVHSWFFSTLAEQGLFGLISVLMLLFQLSKDLLKFTLKVNSNQRIIGISLLSMLFILLFNGFVNPIFFAETQFSIIAGLTAGFIKISTLKFNQKKLLFANK